MSTLKLPNAYEFHDLYTLSGYPRGSSLVVTNNTSSQIRLLHEETFPEVKIGGFPVWPTFTCLVHGNDERELWIKGGVDGYIVVQELTSTVVPFTGIELPHDIMTSKKEGFRRVQVDVAQTGFFEGREFRLARKINAAITYKFVSTVDFILYEQYFSVTTGAYEFDAWRESNVNESTPFTNNITPYVINKNLSGEYRDYSGDRYQSNVSIYTGGSITTIDADAYVDYIEMRTSGSTAQRSSINSSDNTQRYLPAGTYYLRFTTLDTPIKGMYQIGWEERPIGS